MKEKVQKGKPKNFWPLSVTERTGRPKRTRSPTTRLSLKRSKLPASDLKVSPAFSKAAGWRGRAPSSPSAEGEILQDPRSSGGEAKQSGGLFGRGEP